MRSLPPAHALYALVTAAPVVGFAAYWLATDFYGWGGLFAPVIVMEAAPGVWLGAATLASANSKPAEGTPTFSLSGWLVRDLVLVLLSAAAVAVGLTAMSWIRVQDTWYMLLFFGSYVLSLPIGVYGLYQLVRDLAHRSYRSGGPTTAARKFR